MDRDFILDVAMGKVPGYDQSFIIGNRVGQNIVDGVETIWDHDGSIQFLSAETELFVSSSSASDVASAVVVRGYDSDYQTKFSTTVVVGQSQVSVGTFLVIQNVIVAGLSAVGDIYIAESDTLTAGVPNTATKVQSKVPATDNITHNCWLVVPAGMSAITMAIRGTTDSNLKTSKVQTIIHQPTLPPLRTVTYSVSESFPEFSFPSPVSTANVLGGRVVILPEKTIIEFRSEVDTNDTDTFFGADYLIIQSEEFLR